MHNISDIGDFVWYLVQCACLVVWCPCVRCQCVCWAELGSAKSQKERVRDGKSEKRESDDVRRKKFHMREISGKSQNTFLFYVCWFRRVGAEAVRDMVARCKVPGHALRALCPAQLRCMSQRTSTCLVSSAEIYQPWRYTARTRAMLL